MQNTTNFNLKTYEGTDLFNPLTVENENAQAIDTQMKANQSGTVGTANHLLTGSVHAITRVIPNASMFRFTATSKFTVGDSFTVDGVSVTALMPNGTTIPDGAFVIGSTVLCSLVGQLLTIYSYGISEAEDSKKLGGKLPNYYATKAEVNKAQELAESTATVVQNVDKKINNFIEKNHTLQTNEINLTSYSNSDPFICDSDIIATSATLSGAAVTIFVQRQDGQYTPIVADFNEKSNFWLRSSVYLKKGMKVYATSSGGSGYAVARRVL